MAILSGAHELLQTIYIDDAEALEAITIDEDSGQIAVCGGPDIWVYHPDKFGDTPKVGLTKA